MMKVALDFHRYRITLRMTRPARFRFFHGGALMGLLSAALGRHLPVNVIPVVCEMGRVRFEAGENYCLGLTFPGDSGSLPDQLIEGIRRLGLRRNDPSQTPPTLGGNFVLESVKKLPEPDISSQVEILRGRQTLTLHFVSLEGPETPGIQA